MNLTPIELSVLINFGFIAENGLLVWGVLDLLRGRSTNATAPTVPVQPVPSVPGEPGVPGQPAPTPAPPPPVDRFLVCIPFTLIEEGGNDDDPRDPGGRTSRGIRQSPEWDLWRQTHPGLPSDVFKAPQDQILAIYREKYWEAMSCDKLPPGIDMAMFDFGVHSGIGKVSLLQQILGVDADGEIGPDTIAAAQKADPGKTVNALMDRRLAFLQGLKIWPTFAHDFTNRVAHIRSASLAMVGAAAPLPAPAPAPTVSGVPAQLAVMRDLVARGVHATHDNPEIMTWPGFIAMKFSNVPGLGAYCAGYVHDSIAWCGLTMAFCLAKAGILPVFTNGDDLKSFLWAFGWMNGGWGTTIWRWDSGIPISQAKPQPGDICVFDWSSNPGRDPGQGHVTMYDHETPGDYYYCSGGNQGNHLCSTSPMPMGNCVAILRPPAPTA